MASSNIKLFDENKGNMLTDTEFNISAQPLWYSILIFCDLLFDKSRQTVSIEQLIDDIAAGHKYMKVYKQMKMYNDPALNPVLYAQQKK